MGKKKNRGKQREESFDPENSNEGALPSRRKSKKDRLADPFFDEVVPDEDEMPVHQSKPSKANKSKNAFEALNAESSEEDDDEEEEESSSVKQKSSGNAFSAFALEEVDEDEESEIKQTTSNAFALLNDEEEDEEEEEEKQLVKKKSKKKKKEKKGSIAMDNVFDELLQEESEIKVEVKSEELDEIPETGAKSKSKNKKKQNLFEAAFAELEQEGTSQDETPVVKPKKDKKKKKGKSTTFDDLLMEVKAEDNEERVAIEQSEKTKEDSIKQTELPVPLLEEKELPAPPSKTKDKKKKKGRLTNFDDLLMEVEADDNDEDPVLIEKSEETKEDLTKQTEPSLSFLEEKELRAPVSKSRDKKKKKKGGAGGSKAKAEEDDIDALLAEIDGKKDPVSSSDKKQEVKTNEAPVSKSVVESQTTPSASEAITLEEENLAPPPVKTHVEPSIEASVEQEAEEEVTVHNEGQEELVPEVKLTAAQKKKQRKKDKKAREKEKQSASVSEDTKEKKIPAHVRKIQEQLEKKRLEEEKRRQEEEAEKQRLAEEERLRLEEEQRKEEEAKRKAEEKARREELKKEGKILTKKQKAEQARLSAVREQLLKSSGINIASGSAPRATVNPQEQKRIQREREEAKRKAEAERLQAEEEQRLIQQEQDRKRQEELEAQLKAEEELKRIEAAEAEIADNWEDITEDEDEESDHENEVDEEEALIEQADSTSSSSKSEVETASGWGSTTSSSSSEYTTDSEEEREKQIQAAKQKAEARIEEARAAASSENLRSPICCILGHVDTGKTKILDNIRKTNVQDNEAGGITQQIGATYIPSEALLTRTNELRKGREYEIKVPGLLVIDTPGHESFTNLRTRGSSLCDIAILVVDLMHGLEAQTLESIELLRQKKTPFIIALNKVDRINDWKVVPNAPIRESLNRQKKHTLLHYEDRLQACSTMLMERGLNVALYWKNKEPRKIVNMVPTSAITGEGICDMLQLLIKLTTSLMAEKLMFLSEVQCSVLEVKAIEGLGTTVDVVLVNGQLNEGDRIVVCGMTGPIVTTIRSLLTPHPLKELRVKGSYLHHKSIQAAQGIKICAQNLEQAVAGTALRVVREGEEEECKLLAIEEMEDVLSRIDKTGEGVSVQASTLGSLEALLEFLKTPEVQIPVSAIGIGPIHKKDVMRANVMNEKKIKKFAVILAFDVPVTKEARELSEELNVKIFTADIIYHLFDQFKAYVEEVRQAEKRAASTDAVFPCILEIIPTCIFNKKDPIVLGCEVLDGQARLGTPLVVPGKQGRSEVSLGKIESMELNHKAVERADRGDNVAIKIQSTNPEEAARLYGRHFDHTDQLYSRISRDSINALKAFFRDEMTTPDWNLVIKLKKIYQIE